MGYKLGNDYRPWIKGASVFAQIKGNTTLTINRNAATIDTSTKSDFPYATQAPGLRTLTIDAEFNPDLPDATGFGVLQAGANDDTGAPIEFQIRKGGAGGDTADIIFHAMMYVGNFNTTMGRNDVVKSTCQLTLAAAPIVDELA